MNHRVGVRELRAGLATYVRRAAAGQRVIVTSAGADTALLGPVEPSAETGATLDTLVAAGLLLPPRRTDQRRPAEPVPVWAGVRIDRALREVRG